MRKELRRVADEKLDTRYAHLYGLNVSSVEDRWVHAEEKERDGPNWWEEPEEIQKMERGGIVMPNYRFRICSKWR